jgi:palmitoyltransferase ZDHHC4
MVHIPSAIIALDQRLTNGRLTVSLTRFGNYIAYGRHPTVLIFFFLLLSVGEYIYLPGAWPRFSTTHKVLGSISIILPYWFLYLSAYGDPGVITPATHAKFMSLYPYDFSIYNPGSLCSTCNLPKPPRSKHCSVCNRCVARMDHHCIFINNCVGHGNQGHFILLLLSTAILTSYAAIFGLSLIQENVQGRQPGWKLWKPRAFAWHEYFILLTFGIQDDVGVGSVTMLTLLTTPLVWALLIYHIYLIYCGTTTNESMKWEDWKYEMQDGFAFKRALPPNRPRDPQWEAPWTRWPVEPAQVLVRTEDGRPPSGHSGLGVGEWERVWHLRDVENLYDIGFWDNLVDVFIPGYPFKKEAVTDVERGRRGRKPRGTGISQVVNGTT